jgi:parallel beta-helix repeat protein
MKNRYLFLSFQLGALIALPLASRAQGSLTPAGPPAPTMKTLSQIEPGTPISAIPYSITNAGYYYLTTNLIGTSGIVIFTNNVTLDLRGFAMSGNNSGAGILAETDTTNIVVRNGFITQWSEGLYAAFSENCRFEHLTLSQNAFAFTGGDTVIASDCLVEGNSQQGLEVNSGAVITHCIARYNGSEGINAGTEANVSDCVASYNATDGIFIDRGMVRDCLVEGNTNSGIVAFINVLVLNNKCLNNKIAGITSTSGGNRIDGNDVTGNTYGILLSASTGNLVTRNSATQNTTNYNIEAGNTVAPVVLGTSIGTNTNPYANLSY